MKSTHQAAVLGVLLVIALGTGLFRGSITQTDLNTVPGVTLFGSGLAVDDFQFIDQHGNAVDKSSFKPGWRLVFFGYTFCPDICPTTLADLNRVWKKLSPQAQQSVQVVFVSIDPERDTPESLAPYLAYFNPEFMAMTGNVASLERLAEQLNGFYARVEREDGMAYLMDHSSNLMLVDDSWQYRGYIEPPFKRDALVEAFEILAESAASYEF
ncbi:MAG: cytochrome c oxidase assembly protein [Oceanospirillaceae bacterium]|nr:cytochrome c oxidase assembly protein [Oceanospirillaceae bacterium]|tara:strand:+ start:5174 stop:5809 length:636 start_codon:yes stop_codon:yes gene_type:complete